MNKYGSISVFIYSITDSLSMKSELRQKYVFLDLGLILNE